MAAEPSLALIDHVAGASSARAQIARGGWEFVVMQQGPTRRGVCRDTLILAAKLLAPRIEAIGATPALLMTWTTQLDQSWFDDVRGSFEAAASAAAQSLRERPRDHGRRRDDPRVAERRARGEHTVPGAHHNHRDADAAAGDAGEMLAAIGAVEAQATRAFAATHALPLADPENGAAVEPPTKLE
jgi:hypothetical protein